MNNILPLLAIETSGDLCSAAILLEENSFIEINYLQKHIHSKKIFEIIDSILKNSDKEITDVKSIAVSQGPGSFTGLRIGFSAAKGLAFGAKIPIISVPTFSALALQISGFIPMNSEFIVANKASIEDIYISKFQKKENTFITLNEVEVINREYYKEYCDGVSFIFGNTGGQPALVKAESIARWAYLFGKDLLTFEYDYLEPEYLGNPFLKKKKN